MSPVTHFLVGWAVANSARVDKRDRMLIALAGVIPDVDGLGLIWDILSRSGRFDFYQRFHHVFGHNIFFALLVAVSGFMLGAKKRLVAVLMFVSFHLHLLGDYIGARGIGNDFWAVPYFWPLSGRDWYWSHQWPLNGWQNFVITGILLIIAFYWAWKRGYSPIEIVSVRADQGFVQTLRRRFGNPDAETATVSS